MLKTALLFPGQGAQRPGMLAALGRHPEVVRTLHESAEALDRDWTELDEPAALARTDAAQLALAIAGVAAGRALVAEDGRFDVVAGHSVGAFPAAVAAGALGFSDALALVALRGRLMAESHPSGFGMTAVLGLDEAAVGRVVEQARAAGEICVANLNADRQIVVSGAEAALARAAELALDAGARKAERLDVATPSHSPLVAPVAERLAEAMAAIRIETPKIPYVSARRARLLRDGAAIAEDLARNVAEPVRWRDAARLMRELGVETALQAPPGATLCDLMAEAAPDIRAVSMEGGDWASAAALTR